MADAYGASVWMSKNPHELSKYLGRWVAVGESGVLESADSIEKLLKTLDEKTKLEALITRIPTRKEATALIY